MGWSKDDIAKVKELVGEGYSSSQIATVFRTTRNAVIGIVSRAGLRGHSGVVKKTERHKSAAPAFKSKPLKPEPAPELPPIGPIATTADRGLCQYPYGDVATPHWRMCGHPGFPWCDYHKTKVFQQKQGAA